MELGFRPKADLWLEIANDQNTLESSLSFTRRVGAGPATVERVLNGRGGYTRTAERVIVAARGVRLTKAPEAQAQRAIELILSQLPLRSEPVGDPPIRSVTVTSVRAIDICLNGLRRT